MTDYELIRIMLDIPGLLFSCISMLVALLIFLDKRK